LTHGFNIDGSCESFGNQAPRPSVESQLTITPSHLCTLRDNAIVISPEDKSGTILAGGEVGQSSATWEGSERLMVVLYSGPGRRPQDVQRHPE
jgi:hypothetical protein